MTPLLYAIIALAAWVAIIAVVCICSNDWDDLVGFSLLGFVAAAFWPVALPLFMPALVPLAAYHLNIAIRKRLKP